MGTILFSSGTSGNKPKYTVCNNQDLHRQRRAMSHFWDLCPTNGVTINTLPALPHLGYHFAKLYEEYSPYPVINTGGYKVLDPQKHLDLIVNFKATLLIGIEPVISELLMLLTDEQRATIQTVVIANGVSDIFIDAWTKLGINVRATYGFTEAKMAWLTPHNVRDGYHVYRDCEVTFSTENGELIMHSPDYPAGYHTGDMGVVQDYTDYQVINFKITRQDGKQKIVPGCTRA